jgi:hypothetical protein
MDTAVVENKEGTLPGKVSFGILGFAYAVAVYRIPAFLVASFIVMSESTELNVASLAVQLLVGLLLSALAYKCASNSSLKTGMRVCYGTVLGFVFSVGGYSIATSLASH